MAILSGVNPILESLKAGHPLDRILIAKGAGGPRMQQIIDLARRASVPVRFEERAGLDRMAGTPAHQGVVAVGASKRYAELEDVAPAAQLLVVLDGVEDPRNLGAVVRTAVAAGADGLVIPERRAAGLTSTVAHAAAGALEHLKVARVTNLVRSLLELKEHGLWVYGFEAAGPKSYLELDYCGGCVLVLGGEGRGLHRLVREACDLVAQIPLYGPVQSLNVSVAAAVVLYEAARQRQRAADSRHHTGGGGTAAR